MKAGNSLATKEKVAIKIIDKTDLSEADMEMQRNEIEILKIAQHPNIIKMLDIFENEEYLSLVMECMEGGDLFDYQDRRDFKLSDKHCSEISHKLAAALYYLHSYGIAHRDLKPENILMENDARESDVKLSDFGLSKFLGPDEHAKE